MKVIILIVLTVFSCCSSAYAQGWHDIVPLQSSRTDVERLLGKPQGECKCLYEMEGEVIRIDYSKSPCVGYPSGWNVSTDVVLRLNIRFNEPRNFSDFRIAESEFKKAFDDTLTTYYSSREKGVEYTLDQDRKLIEITYIPSNRDSHLRCPCFPALDESTQRSVKYDEFSWHALYALARLDNYAIELSNVERWTGFVIVYKGKLTSAQQARRYRQAIRRHLIQRRGLAPARVVIMDGGYREEPEVELFLLSRELSPPEARATWAPCRKERHRRK